MRVKWTAETSHDDCPQCEALVELAMEKSREEDLTPVVFQGEDDHSVILDRLTMPRSSQIER